MIVSVLGAKASVVRKVINTFSHVPKVHFCSDEIVVN